MDFEVEIKLTLDKKGRLTIVDIDDTVPGLYLSSYDHEDVMEDLLPAIKVLLEENTK